MFSLNFYPEYDSYHAAFRLLRIRRMLSFSISIDTYRTIDYFLCFPFDIERINAGRNYRAPRTLAAKYSYRRPYRYSSAGEQVIFQMWPFQHMALHGLAARSLLDPGQLAHHRVAWTDEKLPLDSALALADLANSKEEDLIDFLTTLITTYPESGKDSLKSRARLLPTNYDVRSNDILD